MNNGNRIPIVGYGTAGDDAFGTNGTNYETVKYAFEVGYTHIDTSLNYGNEKEIGKAVNEFIHTGKLKREDFFIVTKVENNYHSRTGVMKSTNRSFNNLGLDYVDLLLVHWPFAYKEGDDLRPKDKNGKLIFSDIDYLETWKGMEHVHEKGLAKSIGVSNFNHLQLGRIIQNAKIKPALNQVFIY